MRRYKSEKAGGFKMGVMDVIKYNGRPDVFAWKYPGEELGTWSQLVVNQSQEAVLVKGGSVADVFGPGTHTLDTDSGSKVWNIYSDTLEWSVWNSCNRFGEVSDKTCDNHECF